jgi:RsiW-degrading membrane proteinase PrsW (M82 family)
MNIEYLNFGRNLLMMVTLSFLPSLLILRFFYKRDLNPEPRKVLLKTFGLGFILAIPVLAITYPLAPLVWKIRNPMLAAMYWSLFCAAIPEEFFKFLILTRYCTKNPAFDEPMDGIIYGVTASLGFATLESMMFISRIGWTAAIPRALTAVPAHACFGAVMGYYVSKEYFHPKKKGLSIGFGLLAAIFLHSLYDYPLIINQIWKLNTEAPIELAVKLGFFVLFAMVFVFMIIWVYRLVKKVS